MTVDSKNEDRIDSDAPASRYAKSGRGSGGLGRVIVRQGAFALGTLLIISMITFWATSRSPQQAAQNALGKDVSTAQIEEFIDAKGLAEPLASRYVEWLSGFVQGDWGSTLSGDRPVREEISMPVQRSLILAVSALLLVIPIGLGLSVFTSRRIGRWPDAGLMSVLNIITALPEFLIGLLLLFAFGVTLGWLPVDSSGLVFGSTGQMVETFVLPIVTLVVVCIPYTVRMGRAALRETLGAEYVRSAVLRGLPRRTVIREYALRNALVPLINTIALGFVYMIGGVVVIEQVFGFPGIGQRLIEAVQQGDTAVVQAIALIMGFLVIATTFIGELLSVYFNPRLRRSV